MASISNDPNGMRRVLFVARDGVRKAIRLGKVPVKTAESICTKIEALNAAACSNTPIDRETAAWLAGIGDDLHAKLAAAGLIEPRANGSATLADYIERYREHRADVSRGTATNYGIVANRLLAFFPGSTLLRDISAGDTDRWLVWLKTQYAGPTVAKSVKVARQFWAQAIRDGVASANPFGHLRIPSEVNTARAFFIDRATTGRVLEACPDHEWRLLLALARYGGLRTPSEPLTLTWSDINWERQRFRVIAPKTKHEDGGERWIPIFPELLPLLEDAFDRAEVGVVNVITRYRDANANLRTQLGRICRRAGVKTWPRLFQNLRASRETELADSFPIHVVGEWLGNSPKTALAHYTQTTEAHFEQAARGGAESGAVEAQKAAQQASAKDCLVSQNSTEGLVGCEDMRILASVCGDREKNVMTPTGFEPVSRP